MNNRSKTVAHRFRLGPEETDPDRFPLGTERDADFVACEETMAEAVAGKMQHLRTLGCLQESEFAFLWVLAGHGFKLVETKRISPGLLLLPKLDGQACVIAFPPVQTNLKFKEACIAAYQAATAMVEAEEARSQARVQERADAKAQALKAEARAQLSKQTAANDDEARLKEWARQASQDDTMRKIREVFGR
jgi:hypothetical protein